MDENKSILALKIKKMRTDLNLTQEELALKLGLKGKSSIANYESGNITPSDEIKLKMCEIFDCSMDYLMGKSDIKNVDEERKKIANKINQRYRNSLLNLGIDENDVDVLLSHNPLSINTSNKTPNELAQPLVKQIKYISDKYSNETVENFISIMKNLLLEGKNAVIEKRYDKIKKRCNELVEAGNVIVNFIEENKFDKLHMCPVYGRIAAGIPNWAEQCLEGRLPLDPDMMNIHNPEDCFFLRVSGESMNKVIKNGGYALIRKQEDVDNGDIAVVLVNGFDATLKKFTKKENMIILEPMSDDPSFEIQLYGPDTQIKVLGKYIGKFEMN